MSDVNFKGKGNKQHTSNKQCYTEIKKKNWPKRDQGGLNYPLCVVHEIQICCQSNFSLIL